MDVLTADRDRGDYGRMSATSERANVRWLGRASKRSIGEGVAALLLPLSLAPARAQSMSADLMNPVTGSFNGQFDPLRKTGDKQADTANQPDSTKGKSNANADVRRRSVVHSVAKDKAICLAREAH